MAYDDDGGWPAYVPVAERRRQAERQVAKLRKTGQAVSPVRIEGRAIAGTPWGRAWCDNLERYRDYESRLPRGRSYVRNGSVIDLQIRPREVTALVSGSSIYRVTVKVAPTPAAQWRSIRADCAGRIDSLVELLQGRLSEAVMGRICRQGDGLFPQPDDIAFSCTCADHASMCKHVAAVLYGIGARLDAAPELLFRLRAVAETDLLASVGDAQPAAAPAGARVLREEDVSAVFGIDMAGSDAAIDISLSRAPAGQDAASASATPDRGKRGRSAASTAERGKPARASAASTPASLPDAARRASMTIAAPDERTTRVGARKRASDTATVTGKVAQRSPEAPSPTARSRRRAAEPSSTTNAAETSRPGQPRSAAAASSADNLGSRLKARSDSDLDAVMARLDGITRALAELQALPAAVHALSARVEQVMVLAADKRRGVRGVK